MRTSIHVAASLCAMLLALPSLAEAGQPPTAQFPPQPAEVAPQPEPAPPEPAPVAPQPGPVAPQPGPVPPPQPGQYPQQPGQYPQQPGQYPQQYPQQPGQWQQQPGQWQQPGAQPPKPEPKQFASSLGFKLLAGGNLWTKPDNIEPGYDALGFAGSAGGFGWGAALYYEARIAQYLGLELDFGYDSSKLQRDLTYKINEVPFDVTEKVSASGVRWGLLVKGIVPVTFGRVWLGLGPEFVSGSSVTGKVEVTSGNPDPVLKKGIEDSISVTKKRSTMLTMAFGVAIEIGENLEIPLDLRVARNLTQESGWRDRVDTDKVLDKPPKYDVTVQSSWDFRLATGLGYRF